jgi:hypothetical protein
MKGELLQDGVPFVIVNILPLVPGFNQEGTLLTPILVNIAPYVEEVVNLAKDPLK